MSPSLSHQKATQALNFFARQEGGEINRMKALKLIFFADRYHLRKYGRFVVGAHYYAMKNGPVGSEVKQVAELDAEWLDAETQRYAKAFLRKKSPYIFQSLAAPDERVFSKSDLEALNFACEKFGKMGEFKLSEITHSYPEWKRHAQAIGEGKKRIPMNYHDFLLDPPARFDPCHPLTEQERAVALELFADRETFDQHWNGGGGCH